jgi:hypothetical protein
MTDKRNQSIKRKIVSIVMLTSGAALILACGGFAIYETIAVRQSTLGEMMLVGDLIAANSAPGLSFNDSQASEETLAALKTSPHVIAARVYDKNGKPFATYLRLGASSSSALPGLIASDSLGFRRNSLHIARGIFVGNQRIGTVYLERDFSEQNSRLVEYGAISLPVTRVIIPLVSEAHGNAVSRECPHFLNEPVVELSGPLAREEGNNFASPADELRAVPPS